MAEREREPTPKEKLAAQAEAAGATTARPGGSSGGGAGAGAGVQPDGTSGMSGAPTNDAQPQLDTDKPNAEEHDPRVPG